MVRYYVTVAAEDSETQNKTDDNPCVRNCCLDGDNICLGCGRRLAEILEWHRADPERRAHIRLSARSRLLRRQAKYNR